MKKVIYRGDQKVWHTFLQKIVFFFEKRNLQLIVYDVENLSWKFLHDARFLVACILFSELLKITSKKLKSSRSKQIPTGSIYDQIQELLSWNRIERQAYFHFFLKHYPLSYTVAGLNRATS